MNNYIEIKKIMDEYIELMDKLISFEQEKLIAVETKNIELLDDFLKEEQAYLLQLRGLDQKRETTQKQLGIEQLTYRQIIDKVDVSLKHEFETSYEILSEKTKQFKEIVNTIKTCIDVRLHTIDAVKEKFIDLPFENKELGIYDKVLNKTKKTHSQPRKFESTKV